MNDLVAVRLNNVSGLFVATILRDYYRELFRIWSLLYQLIEAPLHGETIAGEYEHSDYGRAVRQRFLSCYAAQLLFP